MTRKLRLTVVGCGDAFGSGGRLQTSYLVEIPGGGRWLIDCGATTLIGLQRLAIDPDGIGTIVISHLHGDHFAGLIWWVLHGQHVSKRRKPLRVIGPPGIAARYKAAGEALFPGMTETQLRFLLVFDELTAGAPMDAPTFRVSAFEVDHPSGAPSHALRFEAENAVLAFSGDTEWTETLIPACRGADLAILECFAFTGSPRYHLSWENISERMGELAAKHILLTHMGPAMLARMGEVDHPNVTLAHDGLVLDI